MKYLFALLAIVILTAPLLAPDMPYEEYTTRSVYIHKAAENLPAGTRIRVIKDSNTVIDVSVPAGFTFSGQLLIVGDLYPE